MKLYYYPETDSLYIELSSKAGADAQEIAPDIVFDYDGDGRIVGIDIDHASKIVDLSDMKTQQTPKKWVVKAQNTYKAAPPTKSATRSGAVRTRTHS
jgi:uncharacterized protein YuzE